MKITDLDYYVLFTFCDIDDETVCYTTSDKNILNTLKVNDKRIKEFRLNDILSFPPQTVKYKIIDIHVRRLVDDTSDYSFGYDGSVSELIGDKKQPLFSIKVYMKNIK